MRVGHFRNNRELLFLAADENYAFFYQQARNLSEEPRILPGDQVIAECVYDSANETVVGGCATNQEMCIMMLFEYQRITDIIYCDSQVVSREDRSFFLAGVENVTWSPTSLDFVVDKLHPLSGLTVKEISDKHVDWTASKRKELEWTHHYRPHVNRCVPEFWTLDPGVYQFSLPGVTVSYPYQATPYQHGGVCTRK